MMRLVWVLVLLPSLLLAQGRAALNSDRLRSDQYLRVSVSFDEAVDWDAYRLIVQDSVQREGWSLHRFSASGSVAELSLRPERSGVLAVVLPRVTPEVSRVEVFPVQGELAEISSPSEQLFGLTAEDALRLKGGADAPSRSQEELAQQRQEVQQRLQQRSIPWVLLGSAVIIVLIYLLWRRYQSVVSTVIVSEEQSMTPKQRALAALEDLMVKQLPRRGLVEPYYNELTGIVRRFLEEQYDVDAPEQTTEEFLRTSQEKRLFSEASLDDLADFLGSADLIKFARASSTEEDCQSAYASAERLVKGAH